MNFQFVDHSKSACGHKHKRKPIEIYDTDMDAPDVLIRHATKGAEKYVIDALKRNKTAARRGKGERGKKQANGDLKDVAADAEVQRIIGAKGRVLEFDIAELD